MALSAYNLLISKTLKENKIPAMIYKGIILSLKTQRSITGRNCNDIDILVEEKNIKKTTIIWKNWVFKQNMVFSKITIILLWKNIILTQIMP